MHQGEQIDPFLLRLQDIRDQLTTIGSTPDPEFMVRTTQNAVSEEWETFDQSILGRATLPGWEEMWQMTKVGSSGKGGQIKKEEEYTSLAFAG